MLKVLSAEVLLLGKESHGANLGKVKLAGKNLMLRGKNLMVRINHFYCKAIGYEPFEVRL